jgi:hypothetical protein
LIVNGFDDLSTTMNFFSPFEHSQLSIGQYKSTPAFVGRLSGLVLFLYPVSGHDIRSMAENYDLSLIFKNSLYNESMKSYLQTSNLPVSQFVDIGVAESFFRKVEEEKDEAEAVIEEP